MKNIFSRFQNGAFITPAENFPKNIVDNIDPFSHSYFDHQNFTFWDAICLLIDSSFTDSSVPKIQKTSQLF